jgi:ATP-binding cassette subfamily B protein
MAHAHTRPDSLSGHVTAAQWRAAFKLFPYVWQFRNRALAAFALLVGAKLANVSVPLVLKEIVDRLGHAGGSIALPMILVVVYGVLRFGNTGLAELRDGLFARVLERTKCNVQHDVFRHLHAQSLRYHLDRRTGGLSVDMERGARSVGILVNILVFNIVPTLLEILMVAGILFLKYDARFGTVTIATLLAYIAFTVLITNWRLQHRRAMNEASAAANTRIIDSLLNYETVKYFNNEGYEADRLRANLQRLEDASVRTEISLAWLNAGQAGIIALGVTVMMLMATQGVAHKTMTIGDLVLVNAYLLQLFIPLNFLGGMYREIRNSLTDMEKLFGLLAKPPEIVDAPGARPLQVSAAEVRFESVGFAYDPRRPILEDVSFVIPSGRKVAVVGPSGAGKSTLSRLLFRFYDVNVGRILVDGQDIRQVTQGSLRSAIGIVPQDTVLFNDSLYHNIAYGRPDASREEVLEAARAAHLDRFVASLPDAYETMVGERGLKLSGGEKQRVAIARAILKNPPILVFDEATSSLDSATEAGIQDELAQIARNRTTLVIAHRLSTIVDADEILVLEGGRIAERGNHAELMMLDGRYAEMWRLQLRHED